MSSTLATHPMPLIALVATIVIAANQGQQFVESMTSTLSVAVWELVAAPLLLLAFISICPLVFIFTAIIVLPVLALVAALLLIIVIVKNVAQLGSQLAPIRTVHVPRTMVFQLYPTLEAQPTPINDTLVTSIPQPLVQPRRFKKRRPINYSGARPAPTIDPLNNAHTRLTAHIARIRSKAWQTEASKEASTPVPELVPIPVTPVATTLPLNDQVGSTKTHSGSTIPSTLVGTDLLAPRVNVKLNALTEAQEQEELVSIATLDSPLSLPGTSSKFEVGIETTGLECTSAPDAPVIETESLPLSTAFVSNTKPDSYAHHTDLVSDSRPIPTNEQGPTSSLDLIVKATSHSVTVSMVGQNTAEIVTHTIPEFVGELVVNDTTVSTAQHVCPSYLSSTLRPMGPEQQFDIPPPTPTTPPQSDKPVLPVTAPSSTQANSNTTPPDLSTFVCDLPAQTPATTIPDDILQAEIEMPVAPAYQDILTEMGLFFDGLVDAPPTLGTSAPTTVDQDSQLGYMRNMSGAAAFTSDIVSTFLPDPIEDYEMFGLDMTQVDVDMTLPSDAELLQLAAAALDAERMDWSHDAVHPVAAGPQNENGPAPLTDQELLELDIFLQMAVDLLAPLIPEISNETFPTADTILDSEALTILPTGDELLTWAGAAIAESTGMVLDDYISMDFDLNLTEADMLLDPSQLEPLDQATQSMIADLTNEVFGPSGAYNPNDLSPFGFADSSSSDPQFDPSELAKMWDELGASLKDWVEQDPGAMNFNEEDMMRMLLEFDALDLTCSPLHMTANKTSTSTPALLGHAPAVQPRRKIKKLPLRRTAIENHARAMMSQEV